MNVESVSSQNNNNNNNVERRSVLTENIRFNNHPEDSWYTGGVLSASLLNISQPISESMCVSDSLNEISYDMTADFSGYNKETFSVNINEDSMHETSRRRAVIVTQYLTF